MYSARITLYLHAVGRPFVPLSLYNLLKKLLDDLSKDFNRACSCVGRALFLKGGLQRFLRRLLRRRPRRPLGWGIITIFHFSGGRRGNGRSGLVGPPARPRPPITTSWIHMMTTLDWDLQAAEKITT